MEALTHQLGGLTLPAATGSRTADDAAFAELVDRHAALMYRVAYTLLRQPQDAEDAVQETLLKLYRTGGWRAMDEERAFLAKSVWRVGLSRLATSAAKAMRHAEDVAALNLPSAGDSPEQAALRSAQQALMQRLIDDLPENFRQALVLSAVDGMRSQEVAQVLGIPEATVRTRVLRAKAEMRKRFAALQLNARNATKEARR